ncbi:MAG: o-succinylbenzoate synthase [Desulfurococcales archaeon]|nr:o-succinylbenzoate synthase [Desulfurococcales archaeon]
MALLAEIELFEVWVRLRSPFETSFGRTVERPAILVRVADDEGAEGWGEVVAGEGPWYSYETYETAWHVLTEYIVPLLSKSRASEPASVWESMRPVRGHPMAKAGVESAVWDLAARRSRLPLWRLIGGVRDRILSGVSIGIQGSVEDTLRIVSRYLEEGYQRIKLKIKPGWDYEPVKRVRSEYPDVLMHVDANASYTLLDAPRLARLDGLGLAMIEQPLEYDDIAGHADLQRIVRTPICLDESIRGLNDAIAAYRLGSAWFINIKPGRVGGISQSKAIHDFWHGSLGRPVWIGGMLETGIGRGHLVALATLPGVSYPNDISASDRYFDEDIVEPPWTLNKDGTISAPKNPGIGVEPRIDLIERLAKRRKKYRIQA